MAPVVKMSELLEAGVHYGHRTHRWNPKMKPYIHGEQKGVYIIDLRQTLKALGDVYVYVRELVRTGGVLLFVGTKSPIADQVRQHAEECDMPYVSERWLGGTLTNFVTVFAQVTKLEEYQSMLEAGQFDQMTKKEALQYTREISRLERNLGGIRQMKSVPDAVFIMDIQKEHIALTEAQKLGISIIAVVDTNCNPDDVDYIIPGNDDSILSGGLMCRVVSEAVKAGRQLAEVAAPKSDESESATPADNQAVPPDSSESAELLNQEKGSDSPTEPEEPEVQSQAEDQGEEIKTEAEIETEGEAETEEEVEAEVEKEDEESKEEEQKEEEEPKPEQTPPEEDQGVDV